MENAIEFKERKINIMAKFVNSSWGIFTISIIASIISFYTLTNWRLTSIENKQSNQENKMEKMTQESNQKFTEILTKLANIEGYFQGKLGK